MITRRRFLQASAATSAIAASGVLWRPGTARAVANSKNLQKWIQPMRQLDILTTARDNPLSIPTVTGTVDPVYANTLVYNVTAAEFSDTLHPSLPATKLWGYHPNGGPTRHLGGVIVTRRGTAARLRMTNTLPASHLLPVDTTLPGANQAQNRIAIHLHGGYVPWTSDGGPFDWWTPAGVGGLSFQNGPGGPTDNLGPFGQPLVAGQADYFYPNDQSTRLLWYHDHAHGTTRLNAYAGLATGYLILDPVNDGYAAAGKIPPITSTYPLVFQDKIFVDPLTTPVTDPTWSLVARPDVQTLGSLWYDHVYNPRAFRMFNGKGTLPPPDPSCIPEFFGDTMLANGLVYPTLTLEAKRYRFLVLNACNARFLNINLFQVAAGADVTTDPKTGFAAVGTVLGPPIIQIGNEAGFLVTETRYPNGIPVNVATFTGNLFLAPAERADIIVDFTGKAGMEFMMYNDSPGPFPAGPPTNDYYLGNPKNPIQPLAGTGPDTRNILRIKVVPATAADPQPAGAILNPNLIDPPVLAPYTTTVAPIPPLTPPAGLGAVLHDLTLNEDFDGYGRLLQRIGTTAPALVGKGFGLDYLASPTEVPAKSAVQVWRVFNLTADSHPIHFHLVNVQVLSRQPFKQVSGVFTPTGAARGPEPDEVGWKETVKMHPGEVTSVLMKFDLPAVPFAVPSSNRATTALASMGMGLLPGQTYNEYVYHCHILEHEEHDMMRPLVVTGNNPKLLSVFPYTQTVNGFTGGTTGNYSIFGDNPITTVTPTNPAFPAVTWSGPLSFTVTVPAGTVPGPMTYTVTDSTGKTATATVDVFGVAPYAASLSALAGGVATFNIAGGKKPYIIASNNAAYQPVPILDAAGATVGFSVTVLPAAVPGTIITFTITDASALVAQATLTLV